MITKFLLPDYDSVTRSKLLLFTMWSLWALKMDSLHPIDSLSLAFNWTFHNTQALSAHHAIEKTLLSHWQEPHLLVLHKHGLALVKKFTSHMLEEDSTKQIFGYLPRSWQTKVTEKVLEGHDVMHRTQSGDGRTDVTHLWHWRSSNFDTTIWWKMRHLF